MKHLVLFLTVIGFAALAQAAPKIKQIDTTKKRVAVKATSQTQLGTKWVSTNSKGQQCTMTVVDKMAGIAILDAKKCNVSTLRAGQMLTKSLFSDTGSNMSGRTESGKFQDWATIREQLKGLSLIGFYSMADEIPGKADNQSFTFVGETSLGVGAEYEYGLGDSLTQGLPISVVGGITYDRSRELSKVKANGITQTTGQIKPSFSLWTLYANGQFNLTERVSGFAGLNYAIPVEKNFGEEKAKSQIGYQVGGSLRLTSSLAIDGIYRWINFKTTNFDELSLDGFTVRGRYRF